MLLLDKRLTAPHRNVGWILSEDSASSQGKSAGYTNNLGSRQKPLLEIELGVLSQRRDNLSQEKKPLMLCLVMNSGAMGLKSKTVSSMN